MELTSDIHDRRELLHRLLVELLDSGPIGFQVIQEEYRRAVMTATENEVARAG